MNKPQHRDDDLRRGPTPAQQIKIDEQHALFDRFWNEEWLPRARARFRAEEERQGRTDGKASSI